MTVEMDITSQASLWFLIFSLPICLWVAFSDLRTMRIPNKAVIALFVVFLLVAPFVLTWGEIPWRLVQLVVVLLIGMVVNAANLLGAGDAKFCAAAAPFVALGDAWLLLQIFVPVVLITYLMHTLVKHSKLRNLAPEWKSWSQGKQFPLGIALGPTLAVYLALGVYYGA